MKLDSALGTLNGMEPGLPASLTASQLMLLDGGTSWEAAAARRIIDLERQILRLQTLAVTDDLTGLLNRRGFRKELDRFVALARRHGETGVLAFVDLDGFKVVNDNYGHAAGDEVLRRVGAGLRRAVRKTDVVVRLGGDEFAVLLVRADRDGGRRRARAIERMLNALTVMWRGTPIGVCASVGIETFGPGDDSEAVIARADAAMYAAKQGRAHALACLEAV